MSDPCVECQGEGKIECFRDEYSVKGGHYTTDWTEECEHCDGTGKEPAHNPHECDCDDCIELMHDDVDCAECRSAGITFGV